MREELWMLMAAVKKEHWAKIDDIITEYCPMSSITMVPDEKIPVILQKIKNTLGEGYLKN